jgi:hypothetical protein
MSNLFFRNFGKRVGKLMPTFVAQYYSFIAFYSKIPKSYSHLKALRIIRLEEKIVLESIKSGTISEADNAANL